MKSLLIALTLAGSSPFVLAEAGVVFENGFEAPAASGRTPKAKGGDLVIEGAAGGWRYFVDAPVATKPGELPGAKDNGGITAGVTDEMVRSGNQALFVEANKLKIPYVGVLFGSKPFRVVPGTDYTVGIWGRVDAKNPVTAGTAQLFLKLHIDFFSDAEGNSQIGDTEYLVQPLPGAAEQKPLFVKNGWRQLRRRVTAPEDAKYMTVTYKVEAAPAEGEASGLIYFDDVTVRGEMPPKGAEAEAAPKTVAEPAAEATKAPQAETGAEQTPAAPAAQAAPAAAPEATPAPKAKRKHKAAAE